MWRASPAVEMWLKRKKKNQGENEGIRTVMGPGSFILYFGLCLWFSGSPLLCVCERHHGNFWNIDWPKKRNTISDCVLMNLLLNWFVNELNKKKIFFYRIYTGLEFHLFETALSVGMCVCACTKCICANVCVCGNLPPLISSSLQCPFSKESIK